MDLQEILRLRDKCRSGSKNWNKFNQMKIDYIESQDPSTKDKIFYYYSYDINLPEGFIPSDTVPKANLYLGKRSELEHSNGVTKQIITYPMISYGDQFYFSIRDGGEDRFGLIGGHVGREGITQGMLTHLENQAGFRESHISRLKIVGLINSNNSEFTKNHLAVVYRVVLRKKNWNQNKGIWVSKDDMKNYRFLEEWLQILVNENIF